MSYGVNFHGTPVYDTYIILVPELIAVCILSERTEFIFNPLNRRETKVSLNRMNVMPLINQYHK